MQTSQSHPLISACQLSIRWEWGITESLSMSWVPSFVLYLTQPPPCQCSDVSPRAWTDCYTSVERLPSAATRASPPTGLETCTSKSAAKPDQESAESAQQLLYRYPSTYRFFCCLQRWASLGPCQHVKRASPRFLAREVGPQISSAVIRFRACRTLELRISRGSANTRAP